MKKSHALAYLRQLCCSGLSKEILLPEFLRAVHHVVPSSNNAFSGTDEYVSPRYYVLEFVDTDLDGPGVVCDYLTPERRGCFVDWFNERPVLVDTGVFDEAFYQSDMYNLVLRRYDQHHVLWALVRHENKPVGMLCLYRPRQQKAFNSHEQALVTGLLPYVAHALHAPSNKDITYADSSDCGMMIMDTQGAIVFLSQEAKSLLALACYPVVTLHSSMVEADLMAKLAQLCRNLEAVFRGRSAPPPSWSFIGSNGRFVFRAYWLNRHNNEPGAMIGMTIEHQEPMVLKIIRAMKNLPISPMQKEVALLLAQGLSSEKIGERLHIKLTTVKDHICKLFNKLDIHEREELLPKMLALESAIQI